MFESFEILTVLLITLLFIYHRRPKIQYLFYGYLFFIAAILLQFPFRFLEVYFRGNISFLPYIPYLPVLAIIVSELTKYFSLKRFMKTRSFKNGILFVIGWVSLESFSFFTVFVYGIFFSFFSININPTLFAGSTYSFLNFLFFFILNLSISVLIVFSIIKKNIFYLIYAIIYSIFVSVALISVSGFQFFVFVIIAFLYSLYIIFRYREFI